MAEMQRKKKKKKQKTKSVDILADVLDEVTKEKSSPKTPTITPTEIKANQTEASTTKVTRSKKIIPSQTLAREATTAIEQHEPAKLEPGKLHPLVKSVLPSWVNKPWRWITPDDTELESQWLITWGEFIIDFSRILNFHVLDLQEVALVYPFQNPLLKKKLTFPQLDKIAEYLVEIEKAKWWDDERTRLRVYWKTLNAFSDELYEYAFQHGYDMVTKYDIVKMKQPWSTLPPSDIYMLMKIMVESKRASWADSDQKTIEFIYE